mmetsp:Transcript_5997/g.13608  ORF Transcript_5997/g.13608 Transcript_5997/m.13608 type:complete len:402 (-) Transcript_5997:294-1499(-)
MWLLTAERIHSLFDKNVRILMLSVKSFAKRNGIASAADGTLSSYSWLNMVVFFLQCVGMLPVLQCPTLMEQHGFKPDPTDRWHCIAGLETSYVSKDMVAKKNIWQRSSQINDASMLLYGFFNFYSSIFPQLTVAASIRYGKMSLHKTSFPKTSRSWRLCMEDPFETCNSHCPHDLGCHVKEDGQKRISEQLKRAAVDLAKLMQQPMAGGDTISAFLFGFLGPNPKSNGKDERGSASTAQHKEKARSNAPRHNDRNRGAKGRQMNNAQNRSHGKALGDAREKGHGTNHNSTSTYMSGRSQMSKHDNDPVPTQKRNSRKDKNKKQNHDIAEANGARSSKQVSQPNNPATNDKFVAKQKERLHQISEEKKKRNALSKQKKTSRNDGNDASLGDKLDKPLNAKRN